MTQYQIEIIQKVKRIRELNNISQIKLADILNLSRGQIANIENPRYQHKYTLKQLKLFCDYVGIPVQNLFSNDNEEKIADIINNIINYNE